MRAHRLRLSPTRLALGLFALTAVVLFRSV